MSRCRHELLHLRRCPECGYDISGLPADHRCPECGTAYDRATILIEGTATGDTRIGRDAWALGVLLVGVYYTLAAVRFIPLGNSLVVIPTIVALIVIVTIVRKRQVAKVGGGDVHLLLTADGLARREHRGLLRGATTFTKWQTTPWSSIARVKVVPYRNFGMRRCRSVSAWKLVITLGFWRSMTSYVRLRPIILRLDARRAALVRNEMRRHIAAAQR